MLIGVLMFLETVTVVSSSISFYHRQWGSGFMGGLMEGSRLGYVKGSVRGSARGHFFGSLVL